MDAVSIHPQGNVHIVVDDEGHMVAGAQCLQLHGLLVKGFIVQILLPQLHEGGAALQALLHLAVQALPVQPAPVRDGIDQQVFPFAVHMMISFQIKQNAAAP